MRIVLALLILIGSLSVGASEFDDMKAAAEQGNASAQYNLGVMYGNGIGTQQDYKDAVKWYKAAAEQGDAEAQHNLGVMYDEGKGTPQDDKEAIKWYKAAAEQRIVEAQYNLALMYGNGEGVPQDYRAAHMWFNLLASFGNKDGANERDRIAARMTSNQVSEAQSFATECSDQNYKNCAQ